MCEHLAALDAELKARRIKETSRGQAWSDNCREWVYYDCVLVLDKLRQRFNFPAFVQDHVNDDQRSGMEAGFYCDLCKDGVMGHHSFFGSGKIHIE